MSYWEPLNIRKLGIFYIVKTTVQIIAKMQIGSCHGSCYCVHSSMSLKIRANMAEMLGNAKKNYQSWIERKGNILDLFIRWPSFRDAKFCVMSQFLAINLCKCWPKYFLLPKETMKHKPEPYRQFKTVIEDFQPVAGCGRMLKTSLRINVLPNVFTVL